MKIKANPKQVKSGDYLDQALMKGLNLRQRDWAKTQVKKFKDFGLPVPYGIIRKGALAKK